MPVQIRRPAQHPLRPLPEALLPGKELLNFWEKANNALFFCCDFRETMAMAEPGDVVYCGPPYVPLSNTANFTSYNGEGFGPEEQRAPARMISFGVRRCVGCDGGNRGKAVEVLILFAAGGGAA